MRPTEMTGPGLYRWHPPDDRLQTTDRTSAGYTGPPMRIGLLITCPPEDTGTSLAAQRFLGQALAGGNEVPRVFFHCEGVRQATCPDGPLRDGWAALGAGGVDLVVCSTAAGRRYIREDGLTAGFRLSGLGQLIEAALEADRFVQFGS